MLHYIIYHFHAPKHRLIRHFPVAYICHFWALAQLEEIKYSTNLKGVRKARQSQLPQTRYVTQIRNTNILQLIGACRVHHQQKQAGKNGMGKCVFLLKNIIFFIILTIIFISKYFRECYSKSKTYWKIYRTPVSISLTQKVKFPSSDITICYWY